VYRAFTAPGALRDWLCQAAQVDARKGGRIYLWWNQGYYTAGTFTDLAPNEFLSFTWQGPGEPAPTAVRIEFQPEGDSTRLTLTHSGFGPGAEWEEIARQIESNWVNVLENLQSVLEQGKDLRFWRRPVFGLMSGELITEEHAAKLGLPSAEGILLSGVVEGLGAAQAGLQKGDVVVSLDGNPITTFDSFTNALQPHNAGDTVPVEFYRDGERRSVDVVLSSRTLPEYPDNAAALGELTRKAYSEVNAELEHLFDGVTDAEADYRRSAPEWSAKDVIGHLIAVESDTQTWIASIIEDVDVEQPFHTNTNERVRSLVEAYSPLPVLLEELRRSQEATAAIIAMLPEKVVERRHLYAQIGLNTVTFDMHHRQHFEEIKALIEEARTKK